MVYGILFIPKQTDKLTNRRAIYGVQFVSECAGVSCPFTEENSPPSKRQSFTPQDNAGLRKSGIVGNLKMKDVYG